MPDTIPEMIGRYFTAYETKDRGAIEALLDEDFIFSSPHDDHIDKAAYFAKCWPNSETVRKFHIEKIFAESDEAFVRYELVMTTGGGFRNTEFFSFSNGKISEIDVYFGRTTRSDETAQ